MQGLQCPVDARACNSRNVAVLSPAAQGAGLGGDSNLRGCPCLEKTGQPM